MKIEFNGTKEELLKMEGLQIVDFWAPWCGPCRMLSPVMDELSQDYNVVKVNTDDNNQLAQDMDIRSIPMVMIIKDGVVVAEKVGAYGKQFYIDLIESVNAETGK